jgi:hypothetical protein
MTKAPEHTRKVAGEAMSESGGYVCTECRRPIRPGYIEAMDLREGANGVMGLDILYVCTRPECPTAGTVTQVYYRWDKTYFDATNGNLKPRLPYRAAPGKSVTLGQVVEAACRMFGNDWEKITNVRDFLRVCRRADKRAEG